MVWMIWPLWWGHIKVDTHHMSGLIRVRASNKSGLMRGRHSREAPTYNFGRRNLGWNNSVEQIAKTDARGLLRQWAHCFQDLRSNQEGCILFQDSNCMTESPDNNIAPDLSVCVLAILFFRVKIFWVGLQTRFCCHLECFHRRKTKQSLPLGNREDGRKTGSRRNRKTFCPSAFISWGITWNRTSLNHLGQSLCNFWFTMAQMKKKCKKWPLYSWQGDEN